MLVIFSLSIFNTRIFSLAISLTCLGVLFSMLKKMEPNGPDLSQRQLQRRFTTPPHQQRDVHTRVPAHVHRRQIPFVDHSDDYPHRQTDQLSEALTRNERCDGKHRPIELTNPTHFPHTPPQAVEYASRFAPIGASGTPQCICRTQLCQGGC
ncbi:hypothetical protein BVI1335_830052 [Burkholderia vietnamiensis]|nr:hypothetical protein BVI1335_830052 [Burkholderia vietnamiensis]